MIHYSLLDCYPELIQLTTTRHSFVEPDDDLNTVDESYRWANMSPYSGDDPDHVASNQECLRQACGAEEWLLLYPYQTHSAEVRVVDQVLMSLSVEERQEALRGVDALVTDLPGVLLGVTTADCVPVLLYDPVCRVVASIHAGWRGTVEGIVGRAVEVMCARYGSDPLNMVAAIGPSIGQEAFEVGDEVAEAFVEKGFPMEQIATRSCSTGKAHIDLWEANRWVLLRSGVSPERIEVAGICTYTHCDTYFSARRLGIASGRMMSVIGIAPSESGEVDAQKSRYGE